MKNLSFFFKLFAQYKIKSCIFVLSYYDFIAQNYLKSVLYRVFCTIFLLKIGRLTAKTKLSMKKVFVTFILAFFTILIFAQTDNSVETKITCTQAYYPSADAMTMDLVNQNSSYYGPTRITNYGNYTNISSVWTFDGDPGIERFYLNFDLSDYYKTINTKILNTDLYLYAVDDGGGTQGALCNRDNKYEFHRVISAWGEYTITWNNSPTIDAQMMLTQHIPSNYPTPNLQDYVFNLNSILINGNTLFPDYQGIMCKPYQEDFNSYYRRVNFWSREATNEEDRPKLKVEYQFPAPQISYNNTTNTISVTNNNDLELLFNNVQYNWTINGKNYTGINVTPKINSIYIIYLQVIITNNIGEDCTYDFDVVINTDLPHENELVLGEIPEICADDAAYCNIPFTASKLTVNSYSVIFNDEHFLNIYNTIPQNQEIRIDLPENVRPNNYTATVIFDTSDGNKSFDIKFTVLYSRAIIAQRWNDVLALKNEYFNGNYVFSAYEWYKNGVPIPNENGSYLYVGANGDELDFTAEYRAKITRKDDGVTLFTCPYYPEYNKDAYLTLHPTIAVPSEPIIIKTEKSGRAIIWNILGFQIAEYQLTNGTNTINAPSVTGTYFLKIENNSSKRQTLKIIVK